MINIDNIKNQKKIKNFIFCFELIFVFIIVGLLIYFHKEIIIDVVLAIFFIIDIFVFSLLLCKYYSIKLNIFDDVIMELKKNYNIDDVNSNEMENISDIIKEKLNNEDVSDINYETVKCIHVKDNKVYLLICKWNKKEYYKKSRNSLSGAETNDMKIEYKEYSDSFVLKPHYSLFIYMKNISGKEDLLDCYKNINLSEIYEKLKPPKFSKEKIWSYLDRCDYENYIYEKQTIVEAIKKDIEEYEKDEYENEYDYLSFIDNRIDDLELNSQEKDLISDILKQMKRQYTIEEKKILLKIHLKDFLLDHLENTSIELKEYIDNYYYDNNGRKKLQRILENKNVHQYCDKDDIIIGIDEFMNKKVILSEFKDESEEYLKIVDESSNDLIKIIDNILK